MRHTWESDTHNNGVVNAVLVCKLNKLQLMATHYVKVKCYGGHKKIKKYTYIPHTHNTQRRFEQLS